MTDTHATTRTQDTRPLQRCLPSPVPRRGRNRRDERGSITIEFAVLAPTVLALLGLLIAAGRYQTCASGVEAASAAGARAASLARSGDQAHDAATRIVTSALDGQHPPCRDLTVTVDTTGFQTPVAQILQTGIPAQVAVTVTCQVDLSDLTVTGLPGAATLSSRTVSVLDTFRATT